MSITTYTTRFLARNLDATLSPEDDADECPECPTGILRKDRHGVQCDVCDHGYDNL